MNTDASQPFSAADPSPARTPEETAAIVRGVVDKHLALAAAARSAESETGTRRRLTRQQTAAYTRGRADGYAECEAEHEGVGLMTLLVGAVIGSAGSGVIMLLLRHL